MVEQVVGPGVYCVYSTGPSSNSYILAGKKIALIDSGLKENTPNLLNSLKGLGLEPGQVSAVFHTHGHCDHFGGDSLFPDAEVWMHVHDGSLVNARDQDFSAGRYFQGAFFPHVNRYYVESEPLPLRPFNLRLLFSRHLRRPNRLRHLPPANHGEDAGPGIGGGMAGRRNPRQHRVSARRRQSRCARRLRLHDAKEAPHDIIAAASRKSTWTGDGCRSEVKAR